MNCFSHALPFLGEPYFVVGTCVPDWLSACDRKCRAREEAAKELSEHSDADIRQLVRGVIQHHHDDDWFHKTLAFNEISMRFSLEIRDLLGSEAGFRPGLLGHIIVELFLDAWLDAKFPGKLDEYYSQVRTVDAEKVQDTINLFATRQTTKLKNYIHAFRKVEYLYDYQDDDKLIYRVNQVFKRVKLSPISDELQDWLPGARQVVYQRGAELLAEYSFAGI